MIEGAHFLDLCSGSGAMAFEAISHGASHATCVDSHPAAIKAIHQNAKELKVTDQITVIRSDALKAIGRLKGPFDIIFIDPPYESTIAHALIEAIDQKEPSNHFFNPDALIILENPLPPPTTTRLHLKKKKSYGNTFLYIFKGEF